MGVRHVWAAGLVLAVTGCGTAPGPPGVAQPARPASAPVPVSASPPGPALPAVVSSVLQTASPDVTGAPRTSRSPAVPPDPTGRASTGWEITVYYTAVESFHDGHPVQVTGCPRLDCTDGTDDLGTYPAGFVDAVRDEGTGRTASGAYLNWSYDIGFWLDSVPRTSDGGALVPFSSAAADPDVLPRGTRFTVAGCGSQEDGSAAPPEVCAALRDASWRITDEFTPGLGGPRHLDAYIGEETGPDFTGSPWYLTLTGARLLLR